MTILSVFAALLQDVPTSGKKAVLLEDLLENHTVNCLTYEENTGHPYRDNLCLFRAIVLYLQRNQRLDEKTSTFL